MTRILLPQLGTGLLDTLKNPYERRCKRLRLAGLRDGSIATRLPGFLIGLSNYEQIGRLQ